MLVPLSIILSSEKTGNNSEELEWDKNIRSGDKKSFRDMFLKYYPKLHRFVMRYVSETSIADEIVQNIFVDIWKNHQNFNINYSLSAYLYSAARNRALNYITRVSPGTNMEEEDLYLLVDERQNPEAELINKELTIAVNEAIEKLPAKCKLIFIMNRKDGLRYSEIAQILGISENTVTTQIARAFKKLRESLSPYIT
jgi:RNA polymerase sigma-70 factor (ECF subfamily)